jgi:molybdopterin/thiamine biosynthesis adenylyltransferase/molybdopterin synthase catalytic subunit/rhodanese-related sulfurtransferase
MAAFSFTSERINESELRKQLQDPAAGGYASFEGWVRNHNEGLPVRHLEYEAFEPLAIKEGERIVAEAIKRFGIEHAACVHRIGDLAIGEMAVWVGVSARHRAEAFAACRYIIDEVKHRVPIWKKEHYENGDSGWVNCERCAAPTTDPAEHATSAHNHSHAHGGSHDHNHSHGASGTHHHGANEDAAVKQGPTLSPNAASSLAAIHGHDAQHLDRHHHAHHHGANEDAAVKQGPTLSPNAASSLAAIQGHEHHRGAAVGHGQSPSPAAASALAATHAHIGAPVPDYSRQMALKEVGAAGQAKLRASRVLVVGCGGLGVPVISYLAGAGIGRLGLIDSDHLEPSNLHRQTMYALADVGKPKAQLAADRVRALNPDVDVRPYTTRLDALNAPDLIAQHDLVIDCTDNFSTKFLLNDYCVQLGKPVVFASVYQYEGQLQIVQPGSACLRCVWPEATRDGIVGNCSEAGVLGPVPGIFGGLQAFEAMKLLLDLPGQLKNELLVLDLLSLTTSRVRTKRASVCPEHAISRATAAQAAAVAQANAAAGARGTAPNQRGQTGGHSAQGLSDAQAVLELSFDTLDQAHDAGYDIVDIREPYELEEIPTPSAHARALPMAQLLYGQLPFKPTRKTVLVCASGRRSLAATQELRERGIADVYSLRGGVKGLQARLFT